MKKILFLFIILFEKNCAIAQCPTITFDTLINPIICYGQTTQIYANGIGGTAPYSYTWSPTAFPGGGPHFVNPTSTVIYTVVTKDANGCLSLPNTLTVTVKPQLIITGSQISLCNNDSALLTPTILSPGNGGPYSYFWGPTFSFSNILQVYSNTTTAVDVYTVNVSDGCTIPSASTTFTVNTNICTGITEIENTLISIYPNPAKNQFYIINQNLSENSLAQLYNNLGQNVKSIIISSQITKIEIDDLPNGIYHLKIRLGRELMHCTNIIKLD